MTAHEQKLLETKFRRRSYKQESASPADDARKLLETGVQPRGGWCGPFAASAVGVLAIGGLLLAVLS